MAGQPGLGNSEKKVRDNAGRQEGVRRLGRRLRLPAAPRAAAMGHQRAATSQSARCCASWARVRSQVRRHRSPTVQAAAGPAPDLAGRDLHGKDGHQLSDGR